MKKFLVLLLALMLAFTLISCDDNPNDDPTSNAPKVNTTVDDIEKYFPTGEGSPESASIMSSVLTDSLSTTIYSDIAERGVEFPSKGEAITYKLEGATVIFDYTGSSPLTKITANGFVGSSSYNEYKYEFWGTAEGYGENINYNLIVEINDKAVFSFVLKPSESGYVATIDDEDFNVTINN